MSSIQPTPSNDYTWLRETRLDPETLNSVFGSIASRLKAQEAKVADYEAAIAQLTEFGLAVISESVGPALAAAREELSELQEQAALLADEIAFIRAGGVDAANVFLAAIPGLDATRVQAAIAELLVKIEALQTAVLLMAPIDSPTFTGNVTLPDGTVVSANAPIERLDRVSRTANITIEKSNRGNLVDIVSGTFTQAFASAATLGAGWWCYLRNSGTGDITLDPNGTETIDGAATLPVISGDVLIIQCDGVALRSLPVSLAAREIIAFDERASGVNGDSSTIGVWTTRTLNTLRQNTIPGASLSGNQITLPPGRYVITAIANSSGPVNVNRARIYDVTNATPLVYGSNSFPNGSGYSIIDGYFSLGSTSTVRLEHYAGATVSSGFGSAYGLGVPEIYAQLHIRKL